MAVEYSSPAQFFPPPPPPRIQARVGGTMPVLCSYFIEFQPKNHRGSMLAALSMFWIFGNVLTAGMAFLIIPHSYLGYYSEKFQFASWRLFVVVCTIPSFMSSFVFFLLPESPKFLLENGQETHAHNVLRKMYIISNRNKRKEDYPVKSLCPSQLARKTTQLEAVGQKIEWTQLKQNFSHSFAGTKKLFQPPYLGVIVNLMAIVFTLSFGYYGLWMWFPELFLRVEQSGGSACSQLPPDVTINKQNSEMSVYRSSFITAASNIPGNLFAVLTVDRLGRKVLLSGSLLLSGASVFFIWFLSSKAEVIAMSCIFGGVSVISWAVLNVISPEAYPTNM
uniref:Synaptic vesicle glycoprotein 2C-like n=1 Tax=Saccoglossus kowalevskii TaxID=10224 RepID=A0ABM0MUI8_SACKO